MRRPRMTHTRTFVEMEVSKRTFDEIAGKLREAGYHHAFLDDPGTVIDMHGIALVLEGRDDG